MKPSARLQPSPLFHTLQQQLPAALARLQRLDSEGIARRCGFLLRCARKIPIPMFLKGLLALAPESDLSLERIASVVGLAAGTTYTKQALSERLGDGLKPFLTEVVMRAMGALHFSVDLSGGLQSFARVLVQDSTVERLPAHLAPLFPGSGNQHGRQCASLKIQWVCDLKNSSVAQLSLSGFTRNDQTAAGDILAVARPGDLVLRDLGYFVGGALGQFIARGIFFLSRFLHCTQLYEAHSGQPLDLPARLRHSPSLDLDLRLGAQRLPVRLVAVPVPEEVANLRRQRAKAAAKRHHRTPPSRAHLFLLGWNLWVTNVSRALWAPKSLLAVYRLRWRVEIVFKTWKSHLGLRRLNCRTARLLELSVLTKLLFCALVCQACDALELQCANAEHVSLLRLGRILGQCACWFSALVVGISVSQWIEFWLTRHAFYESRKDRQNYYEWLAGSKP